MESNMRLRIAIVLLLIAVLLVTGPLAATPLTSPLDGLELCVGWPYMPHPDWPNCEYREECLCWMQPVDKPPVSPLATPASIDRDGPETEEQKHTTTPEQSRALACFIAQLRYHFSRSLCP